MLRIFDKIIHSLLAVRMVRKCLPSPFKTFQSATCPCSTLYSKFHLQHQIAHHDIVYHLSIPLHSYSHRLTVTPPIVEMSRTKWRARKLGQPKTEELRQRLNEDRRNARRALKEQKKQGKLTKDRSTNDAAKSAKNFAAKEVGYSAVKHHFRLTYLAVRYHRKSSRTGQQQRS